ncbi:hypothetical protein ACSSS7_003906 [Eimeria intestinalis]
MRASWALRAWLQRVAASLVGPTVSRTNLKRQETISKLLFFCLLQQRRDADTGSSRQHTPPMLTETAANRRHPELSPQLQPLQLRAKTAAAAAAAAAEATAAVVS